MMLRCIVLVLGWSLTSGLRLSDSPPQGPSCGVCIAGLARTFPIPTLHKNLLANVIDPLKQNGWDPSVFFYLTEKDDPRKDVANPGSGVSLGGLDRAVAMFDPTDQIINQQDPPVPQNSRCSQDCFSERDFPRWYNQWAKVKGCHDLIRKAEERNGRMFHYLLKMRSDLFFVSPIVPDRLFQREAIVVPQGLTAMGNNAVNDWFAACPRHACDAYFQVASMWDSCSGSFKSSIGCGNSEHLLYVQLKNHNISVKEQPLGMTVMPTCEGVACERLSKFCPFTQPQERYMCSSLAHQCNTESETASCNVNPAMYERFAGQAQLRATPQEITEFKRQFDFEKNLHEQTVDRTSCSSLQRASPVFSQYFDEGYNASMINFATDTVCLQGTPQWAGWTCGNFAHTLRGMVAPAYTLLKARGMLHPCMRIKVESTCGASLVQKLLTTVFENSVTLGRCDPSTDHIVNMDTTPYLTRGASTSPNDYKCEHMPGKSNLGMHAAFMFSHGLDGGVVRRSDRAISILMNTRPFSKRDLTNWDEIHDHIKTTVAKFDVDVVKTDIGTRTVVEQAILVAKADFLIMHHGAANNHRYWLSPDSVVIETQPPSSWFCGHSFGHDDVNYILSTDHSDTAGECGNAPSDTCNSQDCVMYTQPKSLFVQFKDRPRKADPSRLTFMLNWVLDGYEPEKDKVGFGTFKRSLESLRLAQNWLKTACRGAALQLVE